MNKKSLITAATALSVGALLAVASPLAASAHVSIGSNTAEAGSFALLDFRVPNESETAGTNSIVISLPQDTPIEYVSYVPVPGWTTTISTTAVTYTADPGTEIVAGQLQVFPLSVGPIPDTGSIAFPVAQVYSDGTVVNWDETTEDAEHPAPVLFVNDEPVEHSHGDEAEDGHDDASLTATESESAGSDVLARVLGIGGLVVGAVGIVIAVTSRRKTSA